MTYSQCQLSQPTKSGTRKQVSYIPSKFAVVGKTVRLKNDEGEWEYGWNVDSAGEPIDESLLPDIHKAIRQHRKNTGDSMLRE